MYAGTAAVCSLGRAPDADQAPLINADYRGHDWLRTSQALRRTSRNPHPVRLPRKKRYWIGSGVQRNGE